MKPAETYTLGQFQNHDFITEEIYKNAFPLTNVPNFPLSILGPPPLGVRWETTNTPKTKNQLPFTFL